MNISLKNRFVKKPVVVNQEEEGEVDRRESFLPSSSSIMLQTPHELKNQFVAGADFFSLNQIKPSRKSLAVLKAELTHEQPALDSKQTHLFFGPHKSVNAGKSRVLHGPRTLDVNKNSVWLCSQPECAFDLAKVKKDPFEDETQTTSMKKVSTRVFAAKKFVTSKVYTKMGNLNLRNISKTVNQGSFCDGCGMDPIVGIIWSCSSCPNYNLCATCYKSGVHGFEDSPLLDNLREYYLVKKYFDKSKHRIPQDIFLVLFRDVCKKQKSKFSFLAAWLTGVVLGYSLKKLKLRGIEIPNLTSETRTKLVSELTPLLARRSDLVISMEWFGDEDDVEISTSPTSNEIETLRVWICTKNDSSSPFCSSTNSMSTVSSGFDRCSSPHSTIFEEDEDAYSSSSLTSTPKGKENRSNASTFRTSGSSDAEQQQLNNSNSMSPVGSPPGTPIEFFSGEPSVEEDEDEMSLM